MIVPVTPAAHVVHRRGSEISLTPREFGVLEFLLQNTGVAVTKTEILQNVWDEFYDGDDNTVEVYVGYLRRKLGREFFETVRGAGYRFLPG